MASKWLVPVAMLAAASSLLACGGHESLAKVSALFPTQAAQVLGGDGFLQSPAGFSARAQEEADPVKAAEASLSRRGGLWLNLPAESDRPATFSLPGGFSIEVRERGLSGAARSVEGAVIYRRAQGESYWAATGEGYEEWVLVENAQDGAIAEWEVRGASLRQAGEAVEIVNPEGTARLRVTAPFAIDADGKKARAWLALHGEVIALYTDARGPALVDPYWTVGTGSMAAARINHTATLLSSGKVLVVGGQGSAGDYLASAELYDPRRGSWTSTGSLATAREKHTATLLPSGDVLVVGGSNTRGCLDSTELYSWRTGTWTPVYRGAGERCEHTATLLSSGDVLVVGGYNGAGILSSAVLYSEGEWRRTGPLHTERRGHTATLLRTGQLLVAGGFGNAGYLNSAELYDPRAQGWGPGGALAVKRYGHTAVLLSTDQVLVAGGVQGTGNHASAELFDPATRRWTATGSLATERYSPTATLLSSGKVVVAGGWNPLPIFDPQYFDRTEIYDPVTGSWTWGASLATGRALHTATLLSSGRVLIAGGTTRYVRLASAELFYASNGTWTPTGSMATARSDHTATLLPSGQVLVAGGRDFNYAFYASAELYNPASESWTPTGSMSVARAAHAATLLPSGQVLVSGGRDSTGSILSTAELYDPATGNWTATGSLQEPHTEHTATLLPSGRVLIGGGLGGSSVELYDPATATWSVPGWRAYRPAVTLLPSGRVLITGGYLGGVAGTWASLYDEVSMSWSDTGSMSVARLGHTATLLRDGNVLVTGGRGSVPLYPNWQEPFALSENWSPLDSAELWDPVTGNWTPTTALPMPRIGHTATLLPSGNVLVAGGYHRGFVQCSPGGRLCPEPRGSGVGYLYEAATQTFLSTGPTVADRYYHTATLLPSGKVLIAGGTTYSRSVATAELYDERG